MSSTPRTRSCRIRRRLRARPRCRGPGLERGPVLPVHVPLGVVRRVHLDVVAAQRRCCGTTWCGGSPRPPRSSHRSRVRRAEYSVPEDAVETRGGDRELGPGPGVAARNPYSSLTASRATRSGRVTNGWWGSSTRARGPSGSFHSAHQPGSAARYSKPPSGGRPPALLQRDRDHPRWAAHLPVADHLDPGGLLDLDRLEHGPLPAARTSSAVASRVGRPVALRRVLGPEQAAHDRRLGVSSAVPRGPHHATRGAYFSGRSRCTMWAPGWCGRPPAAAPSTAG